VYDTPKSDLTSYFVMKITHTSQDTPYFFAGVDQEGRLNIMFYCSCDLGKTVLHTVSVA
jgi:hypothetical protein